jgi:hypothetical protein
VRSVFALALSTLQRHFNENSKQIFPEMKLCSLKPNSYIHVSVNDLYIPRIGRPILLQNRRPDRWNISRSQIHEAEKLGKRPCCFVSGIHKSLLCSVHTGPDMFILLMQCIKTCAMYSHTQYTYSCMHMGHRWA